jgi:hypothetical protein
MSTNNSRRFSGLALAVALFLSISACATCREHPVACAIVGAIVVGSVAATIENNRHDQQQRHSALCCGSDCPNRSNAIIGSCAGR